MTKYLFIVLTLCLLSPSVFGQAKSPTFVIINDGGVGDIQVYIDALNSNNLDKYRHFEQRTVLEFKRGVAVELLSASELSALGIPVDLGLVSHNEDAPVLTSEFFVHPSGRILEMVKPVHKVATPNQ